jgi:hypothetical protein
MNDADEGEVEEREEETDTDLTPDLSEEEDKVDCDDSGLP